LVCIFLEVLVEEIAELVDLVLEAGSTGPALGWIEEVVWDACAGLWHLEVENLVGLELGVRKLTSVDGVENGTSVFERATLAAGGGTSTDPAGVEQPGVGTVLGNLLREHLGVAHGMQSEEGLCETRREGSLWLGDALFCAGHLGGVAGDEVEHSLLGVELGDGWEDTAGIASEEDDVGWVVVTDARNLGVLDVLDGVSTAGVFL